MKHVHSEWRWMLIHHCYGILLYYPVFSESVVWVTRCFLCGSWWNLQGQWDLEKLLTSLAKLRQDMDIQIDMIYHDMHWFSSLLWKTCFCARLSSGETIPSASLALMMMTWEVWEARGPNAAASCFQNMWNKLQHMKQNAGCITNTYKYQITAEWYRIPCKLKSYRIESTCHSMSFVSRDAAFRARVVGKFIQICLNLCLGWLGSRPQLQILQCLNKFQPSQPISWIICECLKITDP